MPEENKTIGLNDEELGKVSGDAGGDGWQGELNTSSYGMHRDGYNWVMTSNCFPVGSKIKFTGQGVWYDDSEYYEVYVENYSSPVYILDSRIRRY